MSIRAERGGRALEREWWLRTLMLLQSPRPVLAAIRQDSDKAASARQEPLTAVAFLAGVSIFLSTSTAGHVFDDAEIRDDTLLLIFEAIFAGALVGLQNVWILGAALFFGARGLGSEGSYRQARHLVGFATAPFVLSLVLVWPVRIALYGNDLFRSGGSDEGTGGAVFRGLDAAFLVWAGCLLALGVRAVNNWDLFRSLGALAVAGLVFAALATLFVVL